MGCGTKITSSYCSYGSEYELSERLEREGEHNLAAKVRHRECLDSYDLRRAEDALERQGLSRHWDFKEENCHCSTEDDY